MVLVHVNSVLVTIASYNFEEILNKQGEHSAYCETDFEGSTP